MVCLLYCPQLYAHRNLSPTPTNRYMEYERSLFVSLEYRFFGVRDQGGRQPGAEVRDPKPRNATSVLLTISFKQIGPTSLVLYLWGGKVDRALTVGEPAESASISHTDSWFLSLQHNTAAPLLLSQRMVSTSRLASLRDLHDGPIRTLSISPTDPPFLISSSSDCTTCFTDLSNTASRLRLRSNTYVTAVTWLSSGISFLGWNDGLVTEMQYLCSSVRTRVVHRCQVLTICK